MTAHIRSILLLGLCAFSFNVSFAQYDGDRGGAGTTRSRDPMATDRNASDYRQAAEGTIAGTGAQALGIVAGNYVLQPMDEISVEVFQEPDLAKMARISADGTISMPLIGNINIGGMSVDDAQDLIEDAYRGDYLIHPNVTILVTGYTQRLIYVHGHVGRPGPVAIPPERAITLSEVINSAGGLTRMARRGNIKIRRLKEGGKTDVIEVDFDDILESPEVSDIKMQDGDHVIVDERIF